jgi:flagellar hook-length control protein FliK
MNAVSPALPAVTAPAPAAASPGPSGQGADAEGGFAGALQQARQGARARETKAERATAEARPQARADGRAAPAEAGSDESAPEAAVRPDADTAGSTDTVLPPWLESALARTAAPAPDVTTTMPPAGAELPPALAAGRDDLALGRAADDDAALGGAPTDTAARADRLALTAADTRDLAATDTAVGPAGNELDAPAAAPAMPTAQAQAATPAGAFSLAAAATPEAVDRPLATPLHSPAFAPALGAQLNLLIKDGVTEARLHLNPAEMGPITVQIQVDGTTARVEMAAEHAVTRQVLEQSMPVLAGALRETGLTLTGGGVFEQARDPRSADPEARTGRGGVGGSADPDSETGTGAEPAQPAALPRGMVDVYA